MVFYNKVKARANSLIGNEADNKMRKEWVVNELHREWEGLKLGPINNLNHQPRLWFNNQTEKWHIWDFDVNDPFESGFTVSDFILMKGNGDLVAVQVKSCWVNFTDVDQFSYCVDFDEDLYNGESVNRELDSCNVVVCDMTDHLLTRAFEKARQNADKLKDILEEDVEAYGTVCVYDHDTRRVDDFFWMRD